MPDDRRRRGFLKIETLAVLAAVLAGCGTTTTMAQSGDAARWLDENRGNRAHVLVEGPDGFSELRGVLIESSSPTEIWIRSTRTEVVPIENVRLIRVEHRGRAVAEGAGLGLLLGVVTGVGIALTDSRPPDCDVLCSPGEAGTLLGVLFGALGAGIGTAIGAVVGQADILTF